MKLEVEQVGLKVVGRSGGCELLRGGNCVPVLCPAPALTTSGYHSQRVPTLKNINWTGDWKEK